MEITINFISFRFPHILILCLLSGTETLVHHNFSLRQTNKDNKDSEKTEQDHKTTKRTIIPPKFQTNNPQEEVEDPLLFLHWGKFERHLVLLNELTGAHKGSHQESWFTIGLALRWLVGNNRISSYDRFKSIKCGTYKRCFICWIGSTEWHEATEDQIRYYLQLSVRYSNVHDNNCM